MAYQFAPPGNTMRQHSEMHWASDRWTEMYDQMREEISRLTQDEMRTILASRKAPRVWEKYASIYVMLVQGEQQRGLFQTVTSTMAILPRETRTFFSKDEDVEPGHSFWSYFKTLAWHTTVMERDGNWVIWYKDEDGPQEVVVEMKGILYGLFRQVASWLSKREEEAASHVRDPVPLFETKIGSPIVPNPTMVSGVAVVQGEWLRFQTAVMALPQVAVNGAMVFMDCEEDYQEAKKTCAVEDLGVVVRSDVGATKLVMEKGDRVYAALCKPGTRPDASSDVMRCQMTPETVRLIFHGGIQYHQTLSRYLDIEGLSTLIRDHLSVGGNLFVMDTEGPAGANGSAEIPDEEFIWEWAIFDVRDQEMYRGQDMVTLGWRLESIMGKKGSLIVVKSFEKEMQVLTRLGFDLYTSSDGALLSGMLDIYPVSSLWDLERGHHTALMGVKQKCMILKYLVEKRIMRDAKQSLEHNYCPIMPSYKRLRKWTTIPVRHNPYTLFFRDLPTKKRPRGRVVKNGSDFPFVTYTSVPVLILAEWVKHHGIARLPWELTDEISFLEREKIERVSKIRLVGPYRVHVIFRRIYEMFGLYLERWGNSDWKMPEPVWSSGYSLEKNPQVTVNLGDPKLMWEHVAQYLGMSYPNVKLVAKELVRYWGACETCEHNFSQTAAMYGLTNSTQEKHLGCTCGQDFLYGYLRHREAVRSGKSKR